ncbi:MAG: RNA polymerase [Methanobacteriota archaeon]|nr:MAG: RNA polymerase [Euryarchaeota archaeon]
MEDKKMATLAEVKEVLLKRQEAQELTAEQKLALEHSQKFSRLEAKKARKLIRELGELEFLTQQNAVKIADIMPTHADDVRVIFAKERANLEKKDVEKILSVVEKYL